MWLSLGAVVGLEAEEVIYTPVCHPQPGEIDGVGPHVMRQENGTTVYLVPAFLRAEPSGSLTRREPPSRVRGMRC